MLELQNHYDGKLEGERRKHMAKDDLKGLFYRNETNLSFEKYVIKMKQTFNVLENYNVPLFEEDKVSQLLDKINCPNNDLKTEVNICRYSHSDSFDKASTHLSTVLSCLFPATQPSSGRYGRRWQVNSAGRGVKGGRGG